MKKLPVSTQLLKLCFLFILILKGNAIFSQVVPEIIFKNPVLEFGSYGQDGAKYRFSNVAPGIDAVLEIRGRSSASVVMSSVDTSGPGLGYDNALQPVVGIPGVAPANSTWSINLRIIFYDAGTTHKAKIPKIKLTGLDIDGDGLTLSEWTEMDMVSSIDTSNINSLNFSTLSTGGDGNNYKVSGTIANATDIDTSATNVMATYNYLNKDQIDFTIGAQTLANTTTAGMRYNSFWFRQFNLNSSTLPLTLVSYSVMLNNNKAEIKWTTSAEINVSHFVIERSMDGINYKDAGVVFAYGSKVDKTNYSFSDNLDNQQPGIFYYRLVTIDADGKSLFSLTRIVKVGKQTDNNISIVTFPNPVSNKLQISIPARWQNNKVVYEMYNTNGQNVIRAESITGNQTRILNVNSLAPGLYIIRLSCNGQMAQQKIIKQ